MAGSHEVRGSIPLGSTNLSGPEISGPFYYFRLRRDGSRGIEPREGQTSPLACLSRALAKRVIARSAMSIPLGFTNFIAPFYRTALFHTIRPAAAAIEQE